MSLSPEWQPRFTVEELRAMSEEQIEAMSNNDMINAHLVAGRSGDEELTMKIFSKMPLAPESLLAAKMTFGVEWILKHKLNTSRADAEYGENWLDRKEAFEANCKFV